ncbi:MAG: hypothetical protein OEY63_00305 [Gemmatimonadota bacterium]|nr:hypothetical protein [Gemmatimonadota bacterium]
MFLRLLLVGREGVDLLLLLLLLLALLEELDDGPLDEERAAGWELLPDLLGAGLALELDRLGAGRALELDLLGAGRALEPDRLGAGRALELDLLEDCVGRAAGLELEPERRCTCGLLVVLLEVSGAALERLLTAAELRLAVVLVAGLAVAVAVADDLLAVTRASFREDSERRATDEVSTELD